MVEIGRGKNGSYTAAQFIEAIPDSGGIISMIAKRVGCNWHTVRRYIDTYATVRQAYEDERNKVGDMLETTALSVAKNGDGPMLRFMLSTVWKDRGYVVKEEHEHSGFIDLGLEQAIDRFDSALSRAIAARSAVRDPDGEV